MFTYRSKSRLSSPLPSLLLFLVLTACKEGELETAPALSPLGWSEESHTAKGTPDYDRVLPQEQVNRMDLIVHPADWRALQEELREPGRESLRVPCTVEFAGKKWSHVALFVPRGAALAQTLRAGVGKLPFELRFDGLAGRHPEVRDQRIYGFRALSLGNGAGDSSLLRQRAAGEIFRDQSAHSPRSAFYRIYVDSGRGCTYFGLYTVFEVPDAPMLEVRFGASDGNLYRAEGGAATLKYFAESAFIKETNRAGRDWSDVKQAITALNAERGDAAAWRAGLEKTFDVYGFLNWLAVNTVIENWDSYGTAAHNYYLYADTKNRELLNWIGWDYSQALRPGSGAHGSLSLALKEVGAEWPLIRHLLDDPVYSEEYYTRMAAAAQASFSLAEMEPLYRSLHALIAPYAVGPQGELRGYTFLRDAAAFESSVDELIDHVNRRQEAVKQALAAR